MDKEIKRCSVCGCNVRQGWGRDKAGLYYCHSHKKLIVEKYVYMTDEEFVEGLKKYGINI